MRLSGLCDGGLSSMVQIMEYNRSLGCQWCLWMPRLSLLWTMGICLYARQCYWLIVLSIWTEGRWWCTSTERWLCLCSLVYSFTYMTGSIAKMIGNNIFNLSVMVRRGALWAGGQLVEFIIKNTGADTITFDSIVCTPVFRRSRGILDIFLHCVERYVTHGSDVLQQWTLSTQASDLVDGCLINHSYYPRKKSWYSLAAISTSFQDWFSVRERTAMSRA